VEAANRSKTLDKIKKPVRFRWDLGISDLLPKWKNLFSTHFLMDDLVAGSAVACIAIPLSLAIALASGVNPEVGLISAIIAGIICAVFGGSEFVVSGPATSMAVVVAAVIQDFGLSGLLFVGFGCGILQVLSGVLGLGKWIRLLPIPVIAGFTAGIAAILLVGQLPRVLGLPPPDQFHVIDVITHIGDFIHHTKAYSLLLSGLALAITFVLPRYSRRLPAPLIALVFPTLIALWTDLPVEKVGNLPLSLPHFQVLGIPSSGRMDLIGITFLVYALATLETLLSSTAVDHLTPGTQHDPNQELIGQGLGNMACSMVGGIPVTGVIVRSSLNVHAGAKTRRAAIFHSLVLIITFYFFESWINQIPVSVLAGILISVAARMLDPRDLIPFWKTTPSDTLIFLVTLFTIVFVDLLMGIQAGIIAALLITLIRIGNVQTQFHKFGSQGISVISLEGALTFLSSAKFDSIRFQLDGSEKATRGIVFDLSGVTAIDTSGATQFVNLLDELNKRQIKYVLKSTSTHFRSILASAATKNQLKGHVALHESDVLTILGEESGQSSLDRLVYGVEKFSQQMSSGYEGLFKKLEKSQKPFALFITCSDSRINPNLITSTDPGELFVVRNVGNIVPLFGSDETPAEGAAIEYALAVLGVKHVIVCGHSGCGAMQEVLSGDIFNPPKSETFPSISAWLKQVEPLRSQISTETSNRQVGELNVLSQIENLKSYPIVSTLLAEKRVQLHAWFYEIGKAQLATWDEETQMFVTIGEKSTLS
jgi:carbonic anhydrase